MRNTSITLMAAGFAALLLGACSAGGSFESNKPPVAEAGPPLVVNVGQLVTLNGSASSDPNNNLASFQWTQTAGTVVLLTGSTTVNPTFTVPQLPLGATLTFRLVVFDSEGLASAPDTVVVTVSDVTTIAVTGTVRFQRIPFRSAPTQLDYDNPILQPARGVLVSAVVAGTTNNVIAQGVTSSTGTYSLTVPTSSNIYIRVEARLLKNDALPMWNIRVQEGANAQAPYRFATAPFSSGVGTQNIDIPANMNHSGLPTGTRASAPFAILDTVYTAIQTVLIAVPDVNLPTLYFDWGSDLGAFFNGQFIALRSDPTEDTDEFDQGVIAHEFGHYLEQNFSRSDSAGGVHGLGDRLDPSVAFSEGFATAFGAIALNNPIYLDSFVNGGNLVVGGFNVETNPPTVGPLPPGLEDLGCWCSESSVWSLVWDLYDDVADANDNVALGFTPIWAAFANAAHRSTPALTSIFSYIASLKAIQAPNAAAIDALVLAQNIDSATINAFANTETHAPFSNILPLYTTIVAGGGPMVLHTTDDGGTYNRAGNRRFLRWVPPEARSYRITVTTNNPNTDSDPDFVIYRNGLGVVDGSNPPSTSGEVQNFTPIAGQTYVIDAYDCANGCQPQAPPLPERQGIPGDYDLTVTITAN